MGRRELAVITAQDYINWATAELVEGQDSPSLRILAGLAPNENLWIIEDYFSKSLRELDIPEATPQEALYNYVDILAEQLVKKEGDAAECVKRIYRAVVKLQYPEIMAGWISLDDAIDAIMGGYEPYYHKPITKENMMEAAAEEASEYLYERNNGRPPQKS